MRTYICMYRAHVLRERFHFHHTIRVAYLYNVCISVLAVGKVYIFID